ncbi:hypothetical protein LCGC14_0519540 [marine sediment metagenome]|uniref:Antitoxin n=1 Tax=marine sediment metagenome TaxID=412755 RepID=A0A0F9S3M8_9ZZZZ|nr:MAG: hypothetical protein Lokiarch_48600 [Candidatus Lokiarchaeum sp. GC14_75]HEC36806.1 DUF433 domain-containing protein [bacterium]
MSDIIESNPKILGGKPIIKGTRVPVALIYELIGLNYSISDILKEYPHLNRDIVVTILNIGKEANENLINVDIDAIISKED